MNLGKYKIQAGRVSFGDFLEKYDIALADFEKKIEQNPFRYIPRFLHFLINWEKGKEIATIQEVDDEISKIKGGMSGKLFLEFFKNVIQECIPDVDFSEEKKKATKKG